MSAVLNRLPVTPARAFATAGIVIAYLFPHVQPNLKAIICGAIVVVYIIGYVVVEAVKHTHGFKALDQLAKTVELEMNPQAVAAIKDAVKGAVYEIRSSDVRSGDTHA